MTKAPSEGATIREGEGMPVARRSDSSSRRGEEVTIASGAPLQSDTIRRAELGVFLRARRAAVAPEQAGMPRGKRRLTPGLRREEVAALANIGVTWYTWLEQGRAINVSAEALHRVAHALSLSGSDEIHLFTLAGLPIPRDARRADLKDPASLQAVLDGFTTGPAVMFGPSFDVLGYNRVWNIIYAIDSYGGSFSRNHVYRLFMDPVRRRLYVDYDLVPRHLVGLLRAQYPSHVGAPEFRQLLGALTAASREFARLWSECHTEPLDLFSLRLQHETLGRLTLCASRFPVEGAQVSSFSLERQRIRKPQPFLRGRARFRKTTQRATGFRCDLWQTYPPESGAWCDRKDVVVTVLRTSRSSCVHRPAPLKSVAKSGLRAQGFLGYSNM